MKTNRSDYAVNLVYSYSHKDSQHRQRMEDSLALLKNDGLLAHWSDQLILPGRRISAAIQRNMGNTDIIAFLLSPDFIASTECMNEWRRARHLASDNPRLFRIPIILRPCSWKDLLKQDDLKALPEDGMPVVEFSSSDRAWLQVYEGIKEVVNELRSTFTAKRTFLAEMERTDFISQQRINLSDIFVFLPLLCHGRKRNDPARAIERVTDVTGLLRKKYAIIHGADRSGKTALARHIFLSLVSQSKPVLHLDLHGAPQRAGAGLLRRAYESEFHGDYALWARQEDKTLVMDNLSSRSDLIDIVADARKTFERIIVTLPSSVFYAFFRDESRLADFEELEIGDLTGAQQEVLIRKRLLLTSGNPVLSDGFVDRVEDRVNSIVISNRIVPRYPFFILCILQVYEAYMPSGLSITSYGHCYYALIVASLVRAGVSSQDSEINACFNFAEHLAFARHQHQSGMGVERFDFGGFVEQYRQEYVISDSIINRLRHHDFGVINEGGEFRTAYMRYFFLGKFLSTNTAENRAVIQRMCEATHVPAHFLTLLFTIHHTSDLEIIEDILIHTLCALEDVQVATLDRVETGRFREIVSGLPKKILSSESVESERRRERERRDEMGVDSEEAEELDHCDEATEVERELNGIYRVLKNNEIMGQVLRNKYGSIKRADLEQIVEIVADGGLRLVNLILKDESEIAEMAYYIRAQNPEYDIVDIRRELRWFSFIWTMVNVEQVVRCINVPEVRASILRVVERMGTPAYDIISYFTALDGAVELDEKHKKLLGGLLGKHKDPFVRSVLSVRTQKYLNTHRTRTPLAQSICSLLGIKYVPRAIGRDANT